MSESLLHNVLISLHILAVIAWMAGLLYLPRLFVYHTASGEGSETEKTLQTMEAKLFRLIMNPAMIAAWVFGLSLVWFDSTRLWGPQFLGTSWMSTKLAGVVFLTGYHHFLGRERKALLNGRRLRSGRFWRLLNEAPFLAAIVMVFAIVTKFGDPRYGG